MLKPSNWIKKGGLFLTAVFILTMLTVNIGVCAAPSKRVAVFPFTMNSPQDLGFLQNGLFSMLSSRLADPGKVDVLDRETVDKVLAQAKESDATKGALNESKARIIGANLGVDYILFGSLTHFGESVSLDASMVDISGKKKTLAFFEQSNNMGDVIPLVNSFAGDINLKVFNRNISNELYAQQVPQAQVQAAPGALQHAGGGAVVGGGMMAIQQGAGQGFSTHLKFEGVIGAMATGDINNDGKSEVVTATDSDLFIYQLEGNQLVQTEKLEFSSTNRIVSMDIADINKNGYPEIFVTSLTIHRDGLQSFVVEYDGSDYVTLEDGEACYYAVITRGDNKILLRQNKGSNPFDGRIYTMMATGGNYTKEKRIRMPRNTSILSFASGALTSEAVDEYLMINLHNRLVLANDTGGVDWESTEKYGKNNHFWLMEQNDADGSYRDRAYLNPRIRFRDVDSNGKPEVIVVKNNEMGGGSVGKIKRFKDGQIEVLSWNGIAMAPVFRTTLVQGWISDFAFVDMDKDGEDELVVSVVDKAKWTILGNSKMSNIISYKLE